VLEPDGWDGETPLPVLLHFHGWARQGDLVVRHQRIATHAKLRGVLLVAPNGLNRSWRFWSQSTPDVAFADDVLRDISKGYPIDPKRIYVSGYSYGGAMAWRYVCETQTPIAALMSIAGTLPQDEPCPQAPSQVRHVHGTADTVMDFPFGPDGDTLHPVALWRAKFRCTQATPKGPWQVEPFLTLTRTEWQDCETGQVALDTHPGGHFIPHGWIGRQLDELLGRPFTYP
jgi:polyhydroxybutyrate depolymerase